MFWWSQGYPWIQWWTPRMQKNCYTHSYGLFNEMLQTRISKGKTCRRQSPRETRHTPFQFSSPYVVTGTVLIFTSNDVWWHVWSIANRGSSHEPWDPKFLLQITQAQNTHMIDLSCSASTTPPTRNQVNTAWSRAPGKQKLAFITNHIVCID